MLKFGLLGEKLGHSMSPQLHEKIMNEKGISGSYDLIEIAKEEFESVFLELKEKGQYRGLSVTIPYKETVLPFLDEISSQVKYIGAVNTIRFDNGKATGYNTDYYGFTELLKANDITVKGKNAIILGAGGASKAVIKALLDMGIYDLTIVSRGKQSFHNLYTVSYEFFRENKLTTDILVNCTPVGMYPNVENSPISKEYINAQTVVDLIYNPKETAFLRFARERGIKAVNGELMLWEQAVKAQEIWNA